MQGGRARTVGSCERVQTHLAAYQPAADHGAFAPRRILLTRGSLDTPARRGYAERLCAAFPGAERIEALDRTHMQLGGLLPQGGAARREAGRRALVVGCLRSVLRRACERDICCPTYLHFSPTAYCTYRCAYCYLAGTRSTVFAPVVKLYVNLEDHLAAIERTARHLEAPASFYVGKLQDALSLDPLTGFSRLLVPFFAERTLARMVLLTKSDAVDNLLGLDHRGHTVVSWSLNPDAVCQEFEGGAPSLARRLEAARHCQEAGYPVRFILMPILLMIWRIVLAVPEPEPQAWSFWSSIWPFFILGIIFFVLEIISLVAMGENEQQTVPAIKDGLFVVIYAILLLSAVPDAG